MKYYVEVDGQSIELDVEELPEGGAFRVRGPGGEHLVNYLETSAHEASIVIDGRSTTFWFSGTNGAIQVSDGRQSFDVRAMDERAKLEASIFGAKMSGRGASEVRSFMPGIVTRVLVKEGDAVRSGAPLLCIEAMKMENEIKAERAGVVRKVLVTAGKKVNAGEALLEIS